MEMEIIKTDSESVTLRMEVTIPLKKGMLDMEDAIQQAVNEAGVTCTKYALSQFDTDGKPIVVGDRKYTSKGRVSKTYQCPFGEFSLCRHVYQSNAGGSTYCPLDNDARILVYSTPKFAKMASMKYSQSSAKHVQRDLKENHGRHISHTYIQNISKAVSEVAASKSWKYSTGVPVPDVLYIAVSLDGTCMLLREDGWRQAMAGSISLYNNEGERIHSTYLAQSPEYGKETFYRELKQEIEAMKKTYPNKKCIGIADGAADNWKFLKSFADVEVPDFFHASEYLTKVSKVLFANKEESGEWLKQACHILKHETDGAELLLKGMQERMKKIKNAAKKEEIEKAITYFTNHLQQMDYSGYLSRKIPIGSGVIEAACKVIIKQRMCSSGMRWNDGGAKSVLILRCFNETDGKWKQFWDKINKMGI
jgi:hypothetical protein